MTRASSDPVSDETLMSRAAKDDLEAFELLVKRHQKRVFHIVYQSLRSEEDAWDVAQEIFIKVYNARASYVENAKFTTWLYRISNNAIIDRVRQLKRRQSNVSMDDLLSEPESSDKGSHQQLELGEMTSQMSTALAGLTERQRSMVILKYYEGCSVKEIAEVFECAVGTVKATLFQSVRLLKERLAKSGIVSAEVI